jgi:hypothetical protein
MKFLMTTDGDSVIIGQLLITACQLEKKNGIESIIPSVAQNVIDTTRAIDHHQMFATQNQDPAEQKVCKSLLLPTYSYPISSSRSPQG